MPATDTVVLVHGIWMTGLEMAVLRWQLGRCGYRTRVFHYASLRRDPAGNARRLSAFLDRIDGDGAIHLLTHSLGGVIACHALADTRPERLGRVLMLGAPLQGSALARHLHGRGLTRWLLGRAARHGLLEAAPECPRGIEVGMIAGLSGYGIGRLLFHRLPRPNDGTVALDETEHPSVGSRMHVRHGHFGMLFSPRVAQAACRFFDCGRFDAS